MVVGARSVCTAVVVPGHVQALECILCVPSPPMQVYNCEGKQPGAKSAAQTELDVSQRVHSHLTCPTIIQVRISSQPSASSPSTSWMLHVVIMAAYCVASSMCGHRMHAVHAFVLGVFCHAML